MRRQVSSGIDRAADARDEVRRERDEEHQIIKQSVDPGEFGGQAEAGVGQDRLPQRELRLVVQASTFPNHCGTTYWVDSLVVHSGTKQLKPNPDQQVRPLLQGRLSQESR